MGRKTFFLFLTLVALSLGYYLLVQKPEHADLMSERPGRVFPSARSYEDVHAIQIKRADGSLTQLMLEENGWNIKLPFEGKANFILTSGMAMALSKAEKIASFEPNLSEFSEYGFDRPHLALEVAMRGEGNPYVLNIGAKHPVNDWYYAQLGHETDRVFLLSGELVRALNKSEYALREKRIFWFSHPTIRRITVRLFGQSFRLFRDSTSEWRLQERPGEAVSNERVHIYLELLENVYAKEFLDRRVVDEHHVGLDRPAGDITILFEDGSYQTLTIGDAWDARDAYYAKRGPEYAPLFLLAKANVHELARAPEDFLDRRVVKLVTEKVRWVELTQGEVKDIFERTDAGVWKKSGMGAPSLYTQEAVAEIVEATRLLNYAGIEAPSESGPPVEAGAELTASLRFLDASRNELNEIDFLKTRQAWFVSNHRENRLYRVSPSDFGVLDILIKTAQPAS